MSKNKAEGQLRLLRSTSHALALTIDNKVAWRSSPPRQAGEFTLPDTWTLLSDDQVTIHTVLLNTGVLDRMCEQVSVAMEKRVGKSYPKWLRDHMAGAVGWPYW